MEERSFKLEMLLIIALPILFSLLGGIYLSDGTDRFFGASPGSGIGLFEVFMGVSLLTGILAFLVYWQKRFPATLVAIVIPLIYSVLIRSLTGETASVFKLFLPMLTFSLPVLGALIYVFYNRIFLRFRTFVFALVSAMLLAVYFRLQYLAMEIGVPQGFWVNRFVSSLLLFIFVALGLSVADMFITGKEMRKLREERRQKILNDEIEDEDDDAL